MILASKAACGAALRLRKSPQLTIAIARADAHVDDFPGSASTDPVWNPPTDIKGIMSDLPTLANREASPLGWLANTLLGPVVGLGALAGLGGPGQAYHFDMEGSKRVVIDITNQGMTVFGDTRLVLGNFNYTNAVSAGQSAYLDRVNGKTGNWDKRLQQVYSYIGQGLHSIQDIFAHGNKGVNGIDTAAGDQQLSWNDIASHQGTFGLISPKNHFDDPNYDWSDCTLTHVKKVGMANSKRHQSTVLTSKGCNRQNSYTYLGPYN